MMTWADTCHTYIQIIIVPPPLHLINNKFSFIFTDSATHDLDDGLYTSTLELDWPLSREDLAQDIECRVESAAIKNTIVTKFSVDLQGESSLPTLNIS